MVADKKAKTSALKSKIIVELSEMDKILYCGTKVIAKVLYHFI